MGLRSKVRYLAIPGGLSLGFLAGSILFGGVLPPRPGLPHAAYLPLVNGGGYVAPTVLRPVTYEELRRAVAVPGAVVIPRLAYYRPSRPLAMAPHTTLDGEGRVTIQGEGITVYRADGVTIRGLEIVDADGDGISVNKSGGVLIERVTLRGWGDGGIDIVRTPPGSARHIVRDCLLSGGAKGMLLGHQLADEDNGARVLLVRVSFVDVGVRTPKVHRAGVTIVGGFVSNWRGPRLDVQLGGHIDANGTRWQAGPKSELGVSLTTGGTAAERGAVIIPYGGAGGAGASGAVWWYVPSARPRAFSRWPIL